MRMVQHKNMPTHPMHMILFPLAHHLESSYALIQVHVESLNYSRFLFREMCSVNQIALSAIPVRSVFGIGCERLAYPHGQSPPAAPVSISHKYGGARACV